MQVEQLETTLITTPGRGRFLVGIIRALGVAMAAAALISGCASTGGGSSGVVDRAEQRWQALLGGDFQTAYGFYSPGFRSSKSLSDFELDMRLRKVQFRDAEFLEQDCQTESCTLKFNVKYQVASPVPGVDIWESKTVLTERWVRTEGQWWFLPDD